MTPFFSELKAPVLDWLYPRRCDACGGRVEEAGRHWCWDCRAEVMVLHQPFCRVCGTPVAGEVTEQFICHQCRKQPPHYDACRSAARFDGAVRESVLALKYHGHQWLVADLVDFLEAAVRTWYQADSFDVVLPVPLYSRRLRERGFNQAGLLAEEMAGRLGMSVEQNFLRRIRDTGTRTRLTGAARRSNLRQAFALKDGVDLSGQTVLLVDDVMTTGTTLSECARVLRNAGARGVFGVTVAHG